VGTLQAVSVILVLGVGDAVEAVQITPTAVALTLIAVCGWIIGMRLPD
jgi:hypothetical protein